MRKKTRNLSQNDHGVLLMLGATLFGGWMRLLPPALAGFPINDGGLFSMMMTALRENGYRLPHFVQYNGLEIPFAYPPLALYTGALIGDLLRISNIEILRWLPAIMSSATIPAFHFLARSMLKSPISAGLATIFFALLPQSATWYIMGGGITRSPGFLFMILATREIYLLFTERTKKRIGLSILYSTLVVLTHPEAALHTIGIGVFFWLMLSRSWSGLKDAALVALGVTIPSSPWWIPLLMTHGASPLLSAIQTGYYSLTNFLQPLVLTITGEPLATLISVFALIGIGHQIAKRELLLPAWLIMHFVLDKRNAQNVAVVPLALLAAIAIHEVIVPAMQKHSRNAEMEGTPALFSSGTVKGFMIFIWLYLLAGMGYAGVQQVGMTVSPANREAFAWAAEHTPEGSNYIILTGKMNLFEDGVNEWFPVLAGRTSLMTLQGTEWMGGASFFERLESAQGLEGCLYEYLPLDCIESAGIQFDYLYIARKPFITQYSERQIPPGDRLIAELEAAAGYQAIYQTEEVVIYEARE